MTTRLEWAPEPRRVAKNDRHSGFVAIDFGTTNTTMTLYDRNVAERPPLPAAQHAALLEAVTSLLTDGLPVTDMPRERHHKEWKGVLDGIAADRLDRPDATAAALVQLIKGTTATSPGELHDLIRDLDRRAATCTEAVRRWLRYRLHRCHEAAFTAPALEQRWLHVVTFGDLESSEVISRAEVRQENPLLVRLRPQTFEGQEKTPVAVLNLKQLVTRVPPESHIDQENRAIGAEGLFAGVVSSLLGRGDGFIEEGRPAFGPGRLDHVVLTYPTMSSPDVRRNLRRIVHETLGVTLVDTDYDEAIAAALFFLMRDLGPHYGTGLEALRARYRPVKGATGAYEENVLVIDVGGGTTDIALVRFLLKDRTARHRVEMLPYTGRDYSIVPTLRGTSGKAQRGGNFLTLRVFHWLKAVIADLVLRSAAESGSTDVRQWLDLTVSELHPSRRDGKKYLAGKLQGDMLAVLRGGTAGRRMHDPDLFADVERVVRTHYRGDPPLDETSADRAGRLFDGLWRLAEKVKLSLNEQPEHVIDELDLRPLIDIAFEESQTSQPGILQKPVLGQATLHDITRPMLEEIAQLALGLAQARLDGPDDRLDRIVLTGKAGMTPLLRTVIKERFCARDADPAKFDSVEIVGERRYAKNAASIGAAWAAVVRGYHLSDDEVRNIVVHGGTDVDIDIDNLFRNLPYTLIRGGGGDHDSTLFKVGDEFPQHRGGRSFLRSRLLRLGDGLTVQRVVYGGTNQEWGSFKWENALVDQQRADPSFEINRTIWPAQISAQVEVDDHQELRLHLWRGEEPGYLVMDRDAIEVVHMADRLADQDIAFGLDMAERITVNRPTGNDDLGGSRVFTTHDSAAGPFFQRFTDDSGRSVDGVISGCPLPDPPRNGQWAFFLDQDERSLELGTVTAPADAAYTSYWATLDETGSLRIHAERPDYWKARDVADLQDHSGKVLTLDISVRPQRGVDPDDPYNGQQ
ncbi:hypothetical protein ACFHYQ_17025 [Sphaerimonospora cavernae]|uniref:Molecular chaperone DnaK (HSP70) n=1 Tax=Sphaerimonospora cavernae TaxID=1740611 RepID=A0ABV6U6D3_9ACTN